jgi:plastocyanin
MNKQHKNELPPTFEPSRLRGSTLLCLLLLSACDKPQQLPAQQVPRGTATVTGTVHFLGTPPEMPVIENRNCHPGATPIKEESVIVNSNQTLKNVFVYIENGPTGSGAAEPPAKLDQINCQYVPHVVGVQIGQPLILTSSDAILHNVHYRPTQNRPENFGFRNAGQTRTVSFTAPEFIRVKCDIHPWMTAHVGVFANPFFAITDDTGQFTLPNLPAGTYTLATWHERFGQLRTQITITDGQSTTTDFTYQPPPETK